MQSCKMPITQDPIIPFFDSGGNTFFPRVAKFLSTSPVCLATPFLLCYNRPVMSANLTSVGLANPIQEGST